MYDKQLFATNRIKTKRKMVFLYFVDFNHLDIIISNFNPHEKMTKILRFIAFLIIYFLSKKCQNI